MRSLRALAAVVVLAAAVAVAPGGPAAATASAGAAPQDRAGGEAGDAGVRAVADALVRSGSTAGFVVSRNPSTGAVEVELPAAAAPGLRSAATAEGRRTAQAVVVRTMASAPDPAACSGDYCSPPLRAGVAISSSSAGCTSAFVARSRSDSKYYVMTAGHCGTVGTSWSTRFADGSTHVIGATHNRTFAGAGDYGIIAVNNPSGWSPRGWVFVRAGADTVRKETYPIRRVGSSRIGLRVCKSGYTTDTTCGTVDRLGVTVQYSGGPTVHGLGEADLCVRPGDSGGPVFASGTAYGIVSGYVPDTCRSFYQGVAGAATALNVRVVTG